MGERVFTFFGACLVFLMVSWVAGGNSPRWLGAEGGLQKHPDTFCVPPSDCPPGSGLWLVAEGQAEPILDGPGLYELREEGLKWPTRAELVCGKSPNDPGATRIQIWLDCVNAGHVHFCGGH